ncbi:MAG: MFS transporter [Deltaproteobacteria bacterium]|nr:MAG: MFS transporter [Deltaproteobacteria bacterium]
MGKQSTGSAATPDLQFETARWSIFVIIILTYVLVYFHRMAPGVVSEFLMAEFQTTGTRLGSLSAIYFFVYAFMQIPSGVIADTLGTRTSIVFGNLIAGTGSLVFGLAGSFEVACVGRFLVGLGVSSVFVSIMKSNSVWFHQSVFGIMSGLTLLFGNLGSVLAAGPLAQVLSVMAWRTVFIGIGGLSLALALLGYLFVRNRPEDLGFSAPNVYTNAVGDAAGRRQGWLRSLGSVVRIFHLWPGFWVQFGMVGALYALMGLWGIPYLRDVHGLAREAAADHMTIMLFSFAVGSLFFGWFSDRIGKRKPLIVCSVASYVFAWLLFMFAPWSPGGAGFVLFGVLGLAGGGFVLTFASAKEIAHPDLSGMAVSVVNTGCFFGATLMQPLFGWLVDLSWDGTVENGIRIYSASNYQHGFIAMLFFGLIALASTFMIKETHCRNIYS